MIDRAALEAGIKFFAEEIEWFTARANARDLDNREEAQRCRDRAADFARCRDAMIETIARLDAGEIE